MNEKNTRPFLSSVFDFSRLDSMCKTERRKREREQMNGTWIMWKNAASEWMRFWTNERREKWTKHEKNREWKRERDTRWEEGREGAWNALPLLSKCDEIFLFDNEWAAWFLGLICYLNLPLNALQHFKLQLLRSDSVFLFSFWFPFSFLADGLFSLVHFILFITHIRSFVLLRPFFSSPTLASHNRSRVVDSFWQLQEC